MTNIEKTTYLLTFNVNIYAETRGNQPESIYDFDGKSIIQYRKGQTLEISEESFVKFIEYGGIRNLDTVAITGEPCSAHFTTECIDNVAKKVVWMQISNYVNTVDYANGISAWAESFQGARMVDQFNGDSYRSDAWLKNQKEEEVACSKELDMEMANEY